MHACGVLRLTMTEFKKKNIHFFFLSKGVAKSFGEKRADPKNQRVINLSFLELDNPFMWLFLFLNFGYVTKVYP